MTWGCPLLVAQNSSNFDRVAVAVASGRLTIDVHIDNEGSAFDQDELLRHVSIGAGLDPQDLFSEAYQTMLASERVLRRDWEDPEEEAAWAHL